MGSMKESPNNRILRPDTKLQEACEALRQHVDNINQAPGIVLQDHVYKSREADSIQSLKVDGVVVGYRLRDLGNCMRRQVYIKVPGHQIADFDASDRERIVTAVFNVFLTPGGSNVEIDQNAPDCLLITQDVATMTLVERSPGLRSIAGGFEA